MINYNWQNVHITMISDDLPGGVLKFECLHEEGFKDGKKEEAIQSVALSCGQTINISNNNNEYTLTLGLGYGTEEEKTLNTFYQKVAALKPTYDLTIVVKDNNNGSVITYPGAIITKPSTIVHKKDGALDAKVWEFKAENRTIIYV